VRVRVTRAGEAAVNVVVTARLGRLRRTLRTDARGYASVRLVRRTRVAAPLRLRAGTSSATAWLRPRKAVAP
jgi:hypothetical protein